MQRAGLDAGHHTQGSRMLVAAGNSHHRVGPWIHRSPEDNLSGTFYLWQENIVLTCMNGLIHNVCNTKNHKNIYIDFTFVMEQT